MKKQSRKAPRVSRRTCPRPRVQPRGAVSCPRCAVYIEALAKATTWLTQDHLYHQSVLNAVLAMLSPKNPRFK